MNKYWIQKDSTEILVKDMTDKHIMNIIRMIENGASFDSEENLSWVLDESVERGLIDQKKRDELYDANEIERECAAELEGLYIDEFWK